MNDGVTEISHSFRLSGIFKLPMSRQASRLDPPLEGDEESNIGVPLKGFNKSL